MGKPRHVICICLDSVLVHSSFIVGGNKSESQTILSLSLCAQTGRVRHIKTDIKDSSQCISPLSVSVKKMNIC